MAEPNDSNFEAIVLNSNLAIPADPSLHKIYHFFIRATSDNNFLVTTQKTLIVGCTSDLTFETNPAFEKIKILTIGQEKTKVYKIIAPIVDLPYC